MSGILNISKKFHYLDENEEPTACWGYFGISYEHREGEDIITYLDEEGNPVKTQSGYAIIVRSLDELGQALDDRYYDENWNPVMCTGGYYGMHREHDEKGRTREDLPVTCSVMLSDAMSETSRRVFLPWKRFRRQQR